MPKQSIGYSVMKLLEKKGYGVSGQDLFLTRVPNSNQIGERAYWVTYAGGTVLRKSVTGERHLAYSVMVNVRSKNAQEVDNTLMEFTQIFNCLECSPLDGYEVVSIETTNFGSRPDLDAEERMYGFVQIQVVVKQTCNEDNGE